MDEMEVKIKYGDLEAIFKGSSENVSREVIEWLNKYIPGIRVATSLFYEPDYLELGRVISNYIRTSKEGEIFLLDNADQLSMHVKILMILSLARILRYSNFRDDESMTLDELSSILAASQKSVSSRLSELRAHGYIDKLREGKTSRYRVTIKGLIHLLSKLRS